MPLYFSPSAFLLGHDTDAHSSFAHTLLVIGAIFSMIAVVLCAVLLISKLVEATTFPSDGFGDVISMSRHHHRHVQRRQQQNGPSQSSSSTFLASVSFFARFWVRSVSTSGAARHHQSNVPTPGHIRVHVS